MRKHRKDKYGCFHLTGQYSHGCTRALCFVTAAFTAASLIANSSLAYASVMVPPIPVDSTGAPAIEETTAQADNGSQAPGGTVAPNTPGDSSGKASGGPGSSAGAGQNRPDSNPSPSGPGGSSASDLFSSITTVNTASANSQEPVIQAMGGYLLDAETGKALYSKNGDTQYYPASITKLMTALLVLENSNLDDMVTFSQTATTNLESGSVSLGLTAGDQLTVRQSLYGLLLKSANEVANGLAEHVAGSVSSFADMMNQKAASLGCTNTHFANPHGLNNSSHYTTPHDMALIARAAFQNQQLLAINQTLQYEIPATKKAGARTINLGHKMFYSNDSRYYEGIIGGKTGYTSLAGNTLVTAAERNGVRLIAVVMKSKGTQYTDTKALLDYGFANRDRILTGVQSQAKWVEDGSRWYFIKDNGQRAAKELMKINDRVYWFDEDGYMAAGWRKLDGENWYYFKKSGAMAVSCWVEDNGVWFYMGTDGAMLRNTTTPDGYTVGDDGVWIQ